MSLSKSESSYIQSSLLAKRRLDGRDLFEYRSTSLETGVSPLANGSAKVKLGGTTGIAGSSGGTEVLAATKLEVQSVGDEEDGVDGGKVVCSVICSAAAYPGHSSSALDDQAADLTSLLHTTLSDASLHPKNLDIVPGKKSWCLYLDAVVLSDEGNILDALFIASRAALWDTKVPRTRPIAYRVPTEKNSMDVDQPQSGLDTRSQNKTVRGVSITRSGGEFELPDYWDEGVVLDGRDEWPVCVTLNLVNPLSKSDPICYLDATSAEEVATPSRLVLVFSFPGGTPYVQGMRMLSPSEVRSEHLAELVKEGQKHARALHMSLTAKLKEEDVRRGIKSRERFESGR